METAMPTSTTAISLVDQLIAMGGPVMGVLMAMAVIGLVAFVYLMLVGTLFAPRYSGALKRMVQQWQKKPDRTVTDKLQAHCTGLKGLNPLSHLVLATMNGRLRQDSASSIQESVSQKAQQALLPFEAPLKVIEVIAALAPLLGLLGTVMGMMEAFSTMAASEGRASATQLSGGIYQALTTTAAGLIVAIPLAAIAAWIEFRLRRLQSTMNRVLFDTLSAAIQKPEPQQLVEPQAATQPAEPDVDWHGQQAVNAVR